MIMKIIGLMSGTSLDGLDVALCSFEEKNGQMQFAIEQAYTYDYSKDWKIRLQSAVSLSGEELTNLDADYGYYLADCVLDFIQKFDCQEVDYIASHGHTVFHQPQNNFTLQIGSGAHIFAKTQIPVIADFRTQDVAMGGQGAPLVPIGDKLLFSDFDYCLNLGGFSNVSFEKDGQRIAFDIVAVNIVLNKLAEQEGFAYDNAGEMGRKGKLLPHLLEQLNNLPYYKQTAPKSLGYEWVEKEIFPLLDMQQNSIADLMATMYEHIAIQIGSVLKGASKKVLVTGGGAYNTFLMEKIKEYASANITQADDLIISYKEALIFAFLGYLKIQHKNNVLASVTGAAKDHIAGIIYS